MRYLRLKTESRVPAFAPLIEVGDRVVISYPLPEGNDWLPLGTTGKVVSFMGGDIVRLDRTGDDSPVARVYLVPTVHLTVLGGES